jgi:tetratricopeptide (TPR) repeat protein
LSCAAALVFAVTFSIGSADQALADEANMATGIGLFQAAKYDDALVSFQAALATDFNNPKLHYYLATTFSHLKRRDQAIKEYRIAYALDPDREVGKLSKQALDLLGASGESTKSPEKEASAEKKPPSDPILDKVTAALQKAAMENRLNSQGQTSQLNDDLQRRAQEQLDRAKQDMQRDNSYYRRGRLIQLPLPPDALRQLDTLKQMYDNQRSSTLDMNNRRSDELQKSADNLQELLTEKGKAGNGPKLVPAGTSLWVRNYQNDSKSTDKATDKNTGVKTIGEKTTTK